jgi:acyl dehydratase
VKALRKIEVGTKLPSLTKSVSDFQIDVSYKRLFLLTENFDSRFKNYALGPNIHTDDAAAKAAGFSGRVVPGIQSFSFISEMLSRFFGMGWVIGGKINVKFIRPFLIGEKITCGAQVKKILASEESNERFAEIKVCCKNSSGDVITTGSARVRIQDTQER